MRPLWERLQLRSLLPQELLIERLLPVALEALETSKLRHRTLRAEQQAVIANRSCILLALALARAALGLRSSKKSPNQVLIVAHQHHSAPELADGLHEVLQALGVEVVGGLI